MTFPAGGPAMITTEAQLDALVDELVGADVYAFDTEFHTERTYRPQLALVQVAWNDTIAIVDPLAVDPRPLARVFDGPGTAIGHAAGQDLAILRAACGTAPSTVFDTQIAAGFLGLSTPSLGMSIERFLGIRLSKSDQLSDWFARPIPPEQLAYAASDVAHLAALRAVMVEQLAAAGRLDWAMEECALALAHRRLETDPLEAWWKVSDVRKVRGRGRGIAQEVAAWRERRASDLDRPRKTVLPDLAIVTIAQKSPRSRRDLDALRGVEARYLAKGADAEILAAVARGRSLSESELHLPPDAVDARDSQVLIAVGAGLIRHIADALTLDPSLLANRADVTNFVVGEPSRLDAGWRRELAGEHLRRLIDGETALAFGPGGQLILEQRSTS